MRVKKGCLKDAADINTPGAKYNSSETWTDLMVPTVEELSKARNNISTPRRLKLGEMLSVMSESHPTPLGGFEKIGRLSEKGR
jgi:hypothetical protein